MGNTWADGAGVMEAGRVTVAAPRPLLSRAIKSLGKVKRHNSRK